MRFRKLLLLLPLLIIAIGVAAQQNEADCEVDVSAIMREVEDICMGIDPNQVCYGREHVNVLPRDEVAELDFQEPGDNADIASIRSLFLSRLDVTAETWGVAQMRLLANTGALPSDVTLLLFGDVSIEDAAPERDSVEVIVRGPAAANIRVNPTTESLVTHTAAPAETLRAIGRLEDNSWLRVENAEGKVGWVVTDLIQLSDSTATFDTLLTELPFAPYYGAMQAFYFESSAESACGSTVSDGLVIQTPNGLARVSLLINEVTVELISTSEEEGATALVQSNEETGLTLDMLNGAASVTVENTTVQVESNQGVSVPITQDNKPAGTPSEPKPVEGDRIDKIVIPIVEEIESTPEPTATPIASATAILTRTAPPSLTPTASETASPTMTATVTDAPSVTATEDIPPTDIVPTTEAPTEEIPPSATIEAPTQEIPPTETTEPPTAEIPPTETPAEVIPTVDTLLTPTDTTAADPTPTEEMPPEALPTTDTAATGDATAQESPSPEFTPTETPAV
jgi:hypothetical protein